MNYTVIGIDPGPKHTAYVVWQDGKLLDRDKIDSARMTVRISAQKYLNSSLQVACEHLQCFGMAVGSETFETAYWIGEFRRFCADRDIPFHRVFRSEEKMTLCQNMRAKDGNIRQALIDRYGPVGTKKQPGPLFGVAGDIWSALAVAVTFQERSKDQSA